MECLFPAGHSRLRFRLTNELESQMTDLPRRLRKDIPLTPYDRPTVYSLREKDYLDCPFGN
jgi:hypothetical protein